MNNTDDDDEGNDTGNEKDTDSGEHQGSAGGSGKNSEEPNPRGCRRKQILGVVVKVPEGLETMVAADLGPRRL